MRKAELALAAALAGAFGPAPARADCISLRSGKVDLEAVSCKVADADEAVTPGGVISEPFKSMSAEDQKKLYDAYKGVIVDGTIASKTLVEEGAKKKTVKVKGETLSAFVPGVASCDKIGKRVSGTLKQTCCDGVSEVPCLLKMSYVLRLKP